MAESARAGAASAGQYELDQLDHALAPLCLGLRGLEIEENARLIIEQLARLRGDFGRFKEDFSLVGKHLFNTRTKFEDAERRMARFEDKLISTGGSNLEAPSASSEIESLPLK